MFFGEQMGKLISNCPKMKVLIDFPSIVQKYAAFYESCFSPAGFEHFKKALSGFIVSENKTLEAINRLFITKVRNQSSFNRFFNRQHFDLERINDCRIAMLQQNESTCFKPTNQRPGGAISIDNTLLKHYGQCFDLIYNLRDYVGGGYSWAHDLITLNYSDEQTDYPVYYQLWEPPDWEAVAVFLKEKDFAINEDQWDHRHENPQQWCNYMRSRYQSGRKKHPEVLDIYKTKVHIAEDLLRKFCEAYPGLDYPIVLDTGFTSAEFCKIIVQDLKRDYVGNLRGDQVLLLAGNQKKSLSDFTQQLKAEHFASCKKSVFQKVGYTYRGKKKYYYAYFANHRIKHFESKQRLVIAFSKEELTGDPYYVITNRLNWYPSGILRFRRQRWPIETYHQEGKAEGLDKYQVRNIEAIQSYVTFVVVTYSILQCAMHDDDLLSSIRQRLQTESGSTLPFLRRLMQAEALVILVEFIFLQIQQGYSLDQILEPLIQCIAYC
jgi:hypothetical protein